MKKKIFVASLAFKMLVLSAVPAGAQYVGGGGEWINVDASIASRHGVGGRYGQDPYGRGGYYGGGYYDPAYLQQMFNLPGGLAACTVDFSTGQVTGCHPVVKNVRAVEAHVQNHAERNELLGTIHAHDGRMHFRPFDDTDPHITTVGGGALAGVGGAAVGGAFGGRKGAAVGGVGGAVLGGWLASRHSHENCLIIEPGAQSGGPLAVPEPVLEPGSEPAGEVEQAPDFEPAYFSPAVGSVVPHDGRIVRNRFEDSIVRVYDGPEKILELAPGDEGMVRADRSSRIWGEAFLKNPKTGEGEWVPLRSGRGMDSLPQEAGWVFGNPTTRPRL